MIWNILCEIVYVVNVIKTNWQEYIAFISSSDVKLTKIMLSWCIFWVLFFLVDKVSCYFDCLQSLSITLIKLCFVHYFLFKKKLIILDWIKENRNQLQQKVETIFVLTTTWLTNILDQINHLSHP
jgi:hypothetical protein